MLHPFTITRTAKRCGASLPLHSHVEAQFILAVSGMAQVHTEAGVWLVPPQIAAWIPPDLTHRLEIITDAELWMVHYEPAVVERWAPASLPNRPFALRITPLLRSLLTAAVSADPGSERAELLVRLMLHELTVLEGAPTFLPMPSSPVGRRVAELIVGDPRHTMDLGELAVRAATSVRTASRLFPSETGMTLKAWRQRARIVGTMSALARGEAIASVAGAAGFSSTAAFSCAFRQVTGMTPRTFSENGS